MTGAVDGSFAAPRHTLVQLSDLHLLADGALLHGLVDSVANLTAALEVVRGAGAATALLLSGDLADAGAPEAYRMVRAMVEPVAAELGAVVVPVMGNHDDRAALREHLLGEDPVDAPLDRVVHLGGLRLVVLDSTVPGRPEGELSEDQLGWLAAELAEPAPDGTVLAVHHPPLPTPLRLPAAIGLRHRGRLGAVLAGSDVRIVLSGHTHVASAGAIAGIPVWTGGATSYASDLLPPVGERVVHAPAISRIDLFDDGVLAGAVPVGPPVWGEMTEAEVDARIASLARR